MSPNAIPIGPKHVLCSGQGGHGQADRGQAETQGPGARVWGQAP